MKATRSRSQVEFLIRDIPEDLWERFKARCDAEGYSYRWVLLRLLKGYVDGTLDLDDVDP